MSIPFTLPIIAKDLAEAEATIASARDSYRFFEVWLDYLREFRPADLARLASAYPDRLLFLFRRERLAPIEAPAKKRLETYLALEGAPAMFDLDMQSQLDDLEAIRQRNIQLRLVLSHHDYARTPDDEELRSILARMALHGAFVRKIAAHCRSPADAGRLLRLASELADSGCRHVVLGMGSHGKITRVAGALWGSFFVFAPADPERASAPGQIQRDDLEHILKLLR